MAKVKENSTVEVNYEGRTEDGKLFDTNLVDVAKAEGVFDQRRPYEPFKVTLGQGNLIPGFEKGLIGMEEGEEKTVNINVEEAYGEVKKELIKKIPKDAERDKDLKEGMVLLVGIGEKGKAPAKV